MSPPLSHLFEVHDISNAGRGVVATQAIPTGTLILDSGPPAFHVIFKTYAKETCAYCFHWDRGRTLPTRDNVVGKVFCTTDCREHWLLEHGEIGVEAWRCLAAFLRAKGKGTNTEEIMADGPPPDTDEIDGAWREAERQSRILRGNRTSNKPPTKAERKALQAVERQMFQAVDSDALSYLLCALLFRRHDPIKWKEEVLSLVMDDRPYKTRRDLDVCCNSFLQLSTIVPMDLLTVLTTDLCLSVTRADNHNAFGIRAGGEDCEEYMGYSVFPSASYFNHSCDPNVLKTRTGRIWAFTAARDIAAGEECCITYLGGDEKGLDRSQRQSRLGEAWGFSCSCRRCEEESSM